MSKVAIASWRQEEPQEVRGQEVRGAHYELVVIGGSSQFELM